MVEWKDISSMRTPKLRLTAEQPLIGECWVPPKKDTPCSKVKERPPQDGRRGEIAFRIKPQTHQRHLEGSNKTLCAWAPRDPARDWTRPTRHAFEYLSASYGGKGQQWLAMGTGALAAADLGDAACEPYHWTTEQTTQKLENNYTKEVLMLLWSF